MAFSRKRERELKRLKKSAAGLWEDQRDVLDHANKVVREVGRQVGHVGREEIAPRVHKTFDDRVMPVVNSGVKATRAAADRTRYKIGTEVFPSVASAVASALAVIEVAKDTRVKDAVREVKRGGKNAGHMLEFSGKKVDKAKKKYIKAAEKFGKKSGIIPAKSGSGVGRFIAMGVVAVALAGIGYAVWQTLRADDELWISDEPEDDFTGAYPVESL